MEKKRLLENGSQSNTDSDNSADSLTDVKLLCDLLEASGKRNVSIHHLMDHVNLNMFVIVGQNLKQQNFPGLY
ncbi:hypothetical protein JOB18_018636 [Solea senegalensis]|uniref:Scaffolding anchor of CK1 domain-containing protein n=1 Tax=Solea senegalensis TaxID=28829 RepID=A0AAV6PRB5_SOLSE|nr:hypothetical protein JOB18_018636 [Solea senegalensis]